jgi:hypothetical protein
MLMYVYYVEIVLNVSFTRYHIYYITPYKYIY